MDYKQLWADYPHWMAVHVANNQPKTQGRARNRKYKGRKNFVTYNKAAIENLKKEYATKQRKGFLVGIFAKFMIALSKLRNSLSKTKNAVNPYNRPDNRNSARFGRDNNFSNKGV